MAKKLTETIPEMKPSLYLSDKDLPEVADWEVGHEYKLLVEVKQTSKSINEYEGKKKMTATFEIAKVKAIDGSASSKSFKDFEDSYKKEK